MSFKLHICLKQNICRLNHIYVFKTEYMVWSVYERNVARVYSIYMNARPCHIPCNIYVFKTEYMSLKLHIYLLERTLRWIEVRARQLSAGHTIAHPVRSCLVLEHRKLEYVVQQHACKMHLWMSEKKCVWGKNHTQRGKLSRIMGGGMRLMGRQRKKGRGIAPAHFLGALGNMSPGTKINQKHKRGGKRVGWHKKDMTRRAIR